MPQPGTLKKLKLNGSIRPFRTNTQKRCPFHYRGLECKSTKSRNTWSNGKFGLGIRNEEGQRLVEFCQENALVITNTLFQQHKRRLYTWTSPDGQCRNQIDYILCRQRWRSSIQSAKTRPEADCGSDHELLIAKFRLKWALGSIITNKASGDDGIPVELFQIQKDDAVKVRHSICQQMWKTQQWPQDWKTSILIPILKKDNAKECSDYHTNVLISHASKVMLKILQARLQQYVNWELSDA